MTFERLTWPTRTDRLSLRPATPADLRAIFEIRRLPEVAEWMPSRPSEYEEFLMHQGQHGSLERCLAIERAGEVIGDLYLHLTDGWAQAEVKDRAAGGQAEIGWSLSPAHQGQGLVTEAATELVRLCFEDLGVRRVTAVAFADNAASVRIMEKLGMRQEARHRRESLHRDLGWVDSVVYALLLEDWTPPRSPADG